MERVIVFLKYFLLFGVIMLLSLSMELAAQAYGESCFSGGNGTADDPYLISDYYQLNNVRYFSDAAFLITQDIMIPETAYYTDGILSGGWLPIALQGTLDGNGFSIGNLKISNDSPYVGMFSINSGTIQNLTIVDSQFYPQSVDQAAGFLAGLNEGTICNCVCTESTIAEGNVGGFEFGGIVGRNMGVLEKCTNRSELECKVASDTTVSIGGLVGSNAGMILDSRNLARVKVFTGSQEEELNVGGIVGLVEYGLVQRSYNKGGLLLDCELDWGAAGGVVGTLRSGMVSDSYHVGSIEIDTNENAATLRIGCFSGLCEYSNVINVYVAGKLLIDEKVEYGFCGATENEGCSFISCYYGTEVNSPNLTIPTGVVAKTEQQLQVSDTFAGYNFGDIWSMKGNPIYPYPELQCVEMEYIKSERCRVWDHVFGPFSSNQDATEDKCETQTAVCSYCGDTITEEIPGSMLKKQGWRLEYNNWRYYVDGIAQKNRWLRDSAGWVYLGSDGNMLKNAWCRDSYGWCYVGPDGYLMRNIWQKDQWDWCYIGYDGYAVINSWLSYGDAWFYMDSNGYRKRNAWIESSGKWYYLDEEGFMATSQWRRDSVGWVYLGRNGAMLTNAWCMDGEGWCYVGANGYALTDCWKKDSIGWLRLGPNGSMLKNCWFWENGYWYYLRLDGYMASNMTCQINGTDYQFAANGICLNP